MLNKHNRKKPSKELLKKIHSLKSKKGKMVAIEPDSSEWFLGDTTLEAITKAEKKFPKSIFFIERVGYKVAGRMKMIKWK